MARIIPKRWLALAMGLICLAGLAARGEEPAGQSSANTPLAVKQESVQRMVEEMEQKFVQLYQALLEAEPEQASRLEQALTQARQDRLRQKMAEITAMLNQGRLDAATTAQAQVLAQLQQLILILTSDDELDKLLKEIRLLEDWKRQVDQIITEQTDLRNQTDQMTHKDQALDQLDQKIQVLKDLIDQQASLNRDTAQATAAGAHKLAGLADRQRLIRRSTDALNKALTPPGPNDRPDSPSPAPGPAQPAPSDDQPAPPSGPARPSGQTGQTGQPSPSPGNADQDSPPALTAPGQQPLGKAVQHQRQAEQEMSKGKGPAAQQQAGRALDQLRKALEELEQQRDRLAKLPPEHFEKLAGSQDQTADKTARLAEQMAKAGSAGASPGSGQDGSGSPDASPQAPGQQDVARAGQKMKQASSRLRSNQPRDARQKQQGAIDDLQQARQQIEEQLAQLRQEMQMEMLAALEQRFTEILQRQREVTLSTADLDRQRRGSSDQPAPLDRPQRLLCASLAEEEQVLASLTDKALQIIIEDGTTVVFPIIVRQVKEDLQAAGGFLARQQTGPYTQQLHRQIEQALEELIQALQRAQELAQQSGQSSSGPTGDMPNPPLVPASAELKLLKSAQLRVNRQTARFERLEPAQADQPEMAGEIRRIGDRQEQVRHMAEQLYDPQAELVPMELQP